MCACLHPPLSLTLEVREQKTPQNYSRVNVRVITYSNYTLPSSLDGRVQVKQYSTLQYRRVQTFYLICPTLFPYSGG